MLSVPDDVQLVYAVSEQRAIVSFNTGDFAILHTEYVAASMEHWGIILSTREEIGTVLHRLLRLLNSVSVEELRNQLRWLNDFR